MGHAEIPAERAHPPTTAPVFFAVATHDYICTPVLGYGEMGRPGFAQHKMTMKEYDADHWFILSHPEELSRDLLAWMETFAA